MDNYMSYVVSPNVRTIGGRTECQWSDVNIDGYVILDGYIANYAGIVGGEKVDIKVGSSSNLATTITFSPGDNSIASVINRINDFIPGLAGLGPTVDDPSQQSVRLSHSTYVEITNIYSRTVDFARIGLPLAVRDSSLIYDYKLVDGTATDIPGGGGSAANRFDNLSLPINIDSGSNVVTVWSTINNIDIECVVGIQMTLFWSNGFEGEPDNSLHNTFQLPSDSEVFTSAPGSDTDNGINALSIAPKRVLFTVMLPIPFAYFNPITFKVPRGSTKLRVGVGTGLNTSSNVPYKSFIELPKITVAVYQGAE